jgi:alginate O-acetyltransferase complex protein AlgI
VAFNSVAFILLFLPVSLVGYYMLAASRWQVLRLLFLIALGLAFYGRSQAHYIPLLAGSIVFNYFLAGRIARSAARPGLQKLLVAVGVSADIGLLLYFKYFGAIFNAGIAALGQGGPLLDIVTPLAISFFTFQQVAYLIDVASNRTAHGPLLQYAAFVSFFPQLLSGPISLHQEVAPQLARQPDCRRAMENILVGLAIFSLGLFKKTVIADTAALGADPLFDAAAAGTGPGLIAAWSGAISYTLQIYFDFSGYSDMAIGVARMFGILLPLNFFSPFRARSMAELWQRWHIGSLASVRRMPPRPCSRHFLPCSSSARGMALAGPLCCSAPCMGCSCASMRSTTSTRGGEEKFIQTPLPPWSPTRS